MPTTRSQTSVGRLQGAKRNLKHRRQQGETQEKTSPNATTGGLKRAASATGGRKAQRKRTRTTDTETPSEKGDLTRATQRGATKEESDEELLKMGRLKEDKNVKKENQHVTFEEPDVKGTIPEQTTGHTFQKKHGVLERGHIYFFYRPKVNLDDIESIDDVAKFSFLLIPRSPKDGAETTDENKEVANQEESIAPAPAPQGEPKEFFRYIMVGKKHLPKAESRHEVFWATVADVGDDLEKLDSGLEKQVYQTKTRGERHKGAARLAGRGMYSILSPTDPNLPPSTKDRSYLFYVLTHPDSPTPVQEQLGIEKNSSFLIQVKNPDQPAPKGMGLKPERRAKYREEGKQEAFGGARVEQRKFIAINPVALIDYQGAELLIIGNKKNADDIVGKGNDKELERVATEEAEELDVQEVMSELVMDVEKFPPDAIEGDWV